MNSHRVRVTRKITRLDGSPVGKSLQGKTLSWYPEQPLSSKPPSSGKCKTPTFNEFLTTVSDWLKSIGSPEFGKYRLQEVWVASSEYTRAKTDFQSFGDYCENLLRVFRDLHEEGVPGDPLKVILKDWVLELDCRISRAKREAGGSQVTRHDQGKAAEAIQAKEIRRLVNAFMTLWNMRTLHTTASEVLSVALSVGKNVDVSHFPFGHLATGFHSLFQGQRVRIHFDSTGDRYFPSAPGDEESLHFQMEGRKGRLQIDLRRAAMSRLNLMKEIGTAVLDECISAFCTDKNRVRQMVGEKKWEALSGSKWRRNACPPPQRQRGRPRDNFVQEQIHFLYDLKIKQWEIKRIVDAIEGKRNDVDLAVRADQARTIRKRAGGFKENYLRYLIDTRALSAKKCPKCVMRWHPSGVLVAIPCKKHKNRGLGMIDRTSPKRMQLLMSSRGSDYYHNELWGV